MSIQLFRESGDQSRSLDVKNDALEQHLAEELHERYSRLIHYILKVFSLPEESHQDLFNQVFLRILRGLKNLKHSDNMRSWIATITRNEIRSYLRRREREIRLDEEGTADVIDLNLYKNGKEPVCTPEEEIYNKQLHSAFQECVEELEEILREPFLLRYREFLKWEDIAAMLGIGVDKVRRRAEKAKQIVIRGVKRRLGVQRID
jgi:RNA polymerase sigma factor (sigma-70 family)